MLGLCWLDERLPFAVGDQLCKILIITGYSKVRFQYASCASTSHATSLHFIHSLHVQCHSSFDPYPCSSILSHPSQPPSQGPSHDLRTKVGEMKANHAWNAVELDDRWLVLMQLHFFSSQYRHYRPPRIVRRTTVPRAARHDAEWNRRSGGGSREPQRR